MKLILFFVFCLLEASVSFSKEDTYKAGIVSVSKNPADLSSYPSLVLEAAKNNVDILVVQLPQKIARSTFGWSDSYEQVVKTLSDSAKQGRIYVATHVLERARCQNKNEIIRTSLVFDREGDVIASYRKPVNAVTNCTADSADIDMFTTDFGVKFGLLMEEDLVLQNADNFKDVKNFIVVGNHASEIPFLSAQQFTKSWTYTTLANVVTPHGIYSGRVGSVVDEENAGQKLVTAELKKNGGLDTPQLAPAVTLAELPSYPGEDLSQYIIRPLDLEASKQGYKETVCHGQFCCQFYVKTGSAGSIPETTYGLAAFSGIRHLGSGHYVGADICAVFACAGLYKRSCDIGSKKNTTNTHFEKITISSNFTAQNSAQFPVILTADSSPVNFRFDSKTVKRTERVTVEVENSNNLISFGIFGRSFVRDYVGAISFSNENSEWSEELYDYIFNDDVQEFFDYLWIRIRVLILVVSIYILEMM